jgi:hypothetical protein
MPKTLLALALAFLVGCGTPVEPRPPQCVESELDVIPEPGVTAPPPIVIVRVCT